MRTAVGIIIADHLPGVKTHRLNAHVLALSRTAEPDDLTIVIRLTRPEVTVRNAPKKIAENQLVEEHVLSPTTPSGFSFKAGLKFVPTIASG